jgi:hypothetical protein
VRRLSASAGLGAALIALILSWSCATPGPAPLTPIAPEGVAQAPSYDGAWMSGSFEKGTLQTVKWYIDIQGGSYTCYDGKDKEVSKGSISIEKGSALIEAMSYLDKKRGENGFEGAGMVSVASGRMPYFLLVGTKISSIVVKGDVMTIAYVYNGRSGAETMNRVKH